jgi:hypothetical protein
MQWSYRLHLDRPDASVLVAALPGPSRKRSTVPYLFQLTYQNTNPRAVGCALLWEVHGGRTPYQIALEREARGGYRWHCTCADAIYRGEDVPFYRCKHVRGLIAIGRPDRVESASSSADADPALDGPRGSP